MGGGGGGTTKANTNITELNGYRYLSDSIMYIMYLNTALVLLCFVAVSASKHNPDHCNTVT